MIGNLGPPSMPAPRRAGPVLLLFFLSGAAGLVYEISWARQLGLLSQFASREE